MTPFVSFCRISLACAVSLVLASACGGNSTPGDEGGGTANGSGGTQAQAGTHAAGRSTAGGGSLGGAASGGASAAGTSAGGGAPGGEGCTAPPEAGLCEAYFQRWYHDVATGLCRPFVYGGCEGNANNYETLEACQNACSGGLNYDACQAPTDCMLAAASCCPFCDGPSLSAHDLIAYNRKHESNRQFQKELLTCESIDAACAPCPAPLPGQSSLMYFAADCMQGRCVVQDLRTSRVTACQDVSECRLRIGMHCCEGCGGGNVVSVRNDGSFEKLVCGDAPQPCPGCVSVLPEGAVPACSEGRCGIEYLPIGAK